MEKILICNPEEAERESFKLILGDSSDLILTEDLTQSIYCLENAKEVKTMLLNVDSSEEFNPKNVKKLIEKFPKLKIIATTNRKGVKEAEEAVKYGAKKYFMRPYKAEEILSLI